MVRFVLFPGCQDMKKVIFVLLPLIVLGRSSAQPTNLEAPLSKGAIVPPQLTFLESPETKEPKEICARALSLFTNRDYDALEKLAAEYRASKAEFADGSWKLAFVYNGLQPSSQAPEDVWTSRQIQIQDWIRAKPDSVTPRIAMARILRDYAWKARGSDWAYKVTQQDWQTFLARLQGGLRYLEETKKLQGKCPAYWSSLQAIGLGLQFNRLEYDKIFEQAIHEFPDYTDYYKYRAIYLLPRWSGREGEWEADLGKSADRVGGEAGDMLYARVFWHIHLHLHWDNVFKENKGISWPRVNRGFDAILKRYPDSLAARTERTHLAALSGDKQRAKEYFLQTNGHVDVGLWNGKNTFDTMFKWMFSK